MNIKYISLAISAVAIASLIAACTKNQIDGSTINTGSAGLNGQLVDLELASVSSKGTKAVIEGTEFPQTGEIGLFLFKDEMATQDYGTGYENIKYLYDSGKKKWTASPSIKVGSTPGYLYGYYPYNSGNTDVKAIPVSSSVNGDDVMYASKQAEPITDKTAANTSITMNHALARVSITVKNNGYIGDAKLTNIKFEGAKSAQTGTLNALDGSITASKSNVTLEVPSDDQTITKTGTTYECLLIPSEKEGNRQAVTLTLTIDGEAKSATLSGNDNGVIIAQGTKSNITITLSNTGIAVQTVSVEDWNVVEVGGHKVTVKLSDDTPADDVMFSASIEGQSVKIIAYPINSRGLICNISGTANCDRERDFRDIHTFTISEIQTDITAIIKYAALPQGTLKGVFTVYKDETLGIAKKIHFSQGNLYYDGTDWGFEQEQYYFRTYSGYGKCDASGYDKDEGTADGHWGLFGWSTSSTTYGMSTSIGPDDYKGIFIDWGNAVDGSIWRTLTKDEWQYLFDHHTNVWGICNSVPGRFIAPDGFVGGESALSSIISGWETAKSAGVVFLPAAGFRGFPEGSDVGELGETGDYWTSSSNADNAASYVNFGEYTVFPQSNNWRYYGHSVRLVTDSK